MIVTIKELIKQLNDMALIYGDRNILTITDGENEYRIKDITGMQCSRYSKPIDRVSEVIIRIDKA